MNSFNNIYKDKRILVTGNTGFKGSWLTIWLLELGAKVIGFSLDSGHEKGIFNLANLKDRITSIKGDIRNLSQLADVFSEYQPEFVFHLAAQPLVRESYNNPTTTFETNILGTVNILECIRNSNSVKSAILVTSDKCYRNKEWIWSYRENDELGGLDPYSASKGCAELVINSYINSFFKNGNKNVASVRAGNVIGGGDWAKDRIIPDSIKALQEDRSIEVRNPNSTRPWQHVLDPLNGYLLLSSKLVGGNELEGSWNFGPDFESVIPVKEIVEKIIEKWGSGSWENISIADNKYEAKLLGLDCSKSKLLLGWRPKLDVNSAVKLTVEWYSNYDKIDVYELCKKQINFFSNLDNKERGGVT